MATFCFVLGNVPAYSGLHPASFGISIGLLFWDAPSKGGLDTRVWLRPWSMYLRYLCTPGFSFRDLVSGILAWCLLSLCFVARQGITRPCFWSGLVRFGLGSFSAWETRVTHTPYRIFWSIVFF